MNTSNSNRHAGWLIAAAFIGPGTVTTASIAGAQYGFSVLWALIFSIVATLVLQEMAVRLGVVTKQGLASAIHAQFTSPLGRWIAALLIISAIGVGNTAYQGGNLTGAALGLNQITALPIPFWIISLAMIAAGLLWFGSYKHIEKTLLALVATMSIIFLITVMVAKPDWSALLNQAISPRFDAAILDHSIGINWHHSCAL